MYAKVSRSLLSFLSVAHVAMSTFLNITSLHICILILLCTYILTNTLHTDLFSRALSTALLGQTRTAALCPARSSDGQTLTFASCFYPAMGSSSVSRCMMSGTVQPSLTGACVKCSTKIFQYTAQAKPRHPWPALLSGNFAMPTHRHAAQQQATTMLCLERRELSV